MSPANGPQNLIALSSFKNCTQALPSPDRSPQAGYGSHPACIDARVLHQMADLMAPSLRGLKLAIRAPSQGDTAQQQPGGNGSIQSLKALGAMTQLRSVSLRYEETVATSVGAVAAGGGAATAAASTIGALRHPDSGPSSFLDATQRFQRSLGALSPLTALSLLEHLTVNLSFPPYGGSSSSCRIGSSAWWLQLLPSFPHLVHLDLTLVLQDCSGVLLNGSAKPCLPPGSLPGLRSAAVRVRGYRGVSDAHATGTLTQLCRQLISSSSRGGSLSEGSRTDIGDRSRDTNGEGTSHCLHRLSLGLCSVDPVIKIPDELWDLLLFSNQRVGEFELDLSSESRITSLFGPPLPPPTGPEFVPTAAAAMASPAAEWPLSGLWLLPRTTAEWEIPTSTTSIGQTGLRLPIERLVQRVLMTQRDKPRICDVLCGSNHASNRGSEIGSNSGSDNYKKTTCSCENQNRDLPHHSPAPRSLSLTSFKSLRVLRSHSLGALPSHLQPCSQLLVLTPRLIGQIAVLGSLKTLQLEFQTSVLQPWSRYLSHYPDNGTGLFCLPPFQPPREGFTPFNVSDAASASSLDKMGAASHRLESSNKGGGGSALLLLVRGLPGLSSLILKSCGTHTETFAGLPRASVHPAARGLALDRYAQLWHSHLQAPYPTSAGIGGAASEAAEAMAGGGDNEGGISWLRVDDAVVSAASASRWRTGLEELQLVGLDMGGLSEGGLRALEGMEGLGRGTLVLSRAPVQR